ncbi:glycosyltransferase family 4 protein [Clostridium hydrogenum]|uniref:glycosyltransferase family 4 protein n=1 Tax=Clostridium hydrogenum TaxID=2855764 RepID=UPI001F459FB4|nr:glycosyltransferase family 4 protein [Clostridium hydrogenum]
MPLILHITPHMGGGVGKVLSGISCYEEKNNNSNFKHKIIVLEQPEKMNFINICKDSGVDICCSSSLKYIENEMLKADIVQIEWWHHPLIAKLLKDFPKVSVRLIIWSHISGCNYPSLPFEFVKIPHKFLFTSEYSLENPLWTQTERKYAEENCSVVNSSGEFNLKLKKDYTRKNDKFVIGYCGTLNYSKIHPNFIDYCASIDILNVKYVLVGDDDNKQKIQAQAKEKGIEDKFEFTGYTNDIYNELSKFDIFAYPLNPYHFGTTENALLEAMAFGLPVVVLNQCTEKYIVKHMETGLLANGIEDYAACIKYLYSNPDVACKIGENARNHVINTYSIEKTCNGLSVVYDEVLNLEKKLFDFKKVFGDAPYNWFLACLGKDKKLFEDSINDKLFDEDKKIIENKIFNCRNILKEKSKSSINQFYKYFETDEHIAYWKSIIDD